ncbi:MAG: DUF2807 domain-containing protein [Acidobacteriota bacterium]
MKTFTTLVLLIAGASGTALANDCAFRANREGSFQISGARSIDVLAHAGDLSIVGRPGLTQARASGVACASRKELLDSIRIVGTRSGDSLDIETEMPQDLGGLASLFGFGDYARLDLTLEVPDAVPLIVRDGSGDTIIENVAGLTLEDGSGEIRISGVHGNVRVRDGSGDMEIRRTAGNVEISDGSGDITVQGVGGDVVIDSDGSGDIDIADVTRNVLVKNDGSGSISVAWVKGTFTVDDDGSGGIHYRDVAGKVTLPPDR